MPSRDTFPFGTSGHKVPFLDQANTFSAAQEFASGATIGGLPIVTNGKHNDATALNGTQLGIVLNNSANYNCVLRIDASGASGTVSNNLSTGGGGFPDGQWVLIIKQDSSANRIVIGNGASDLAWLSAQGDWAMFEYWGSTWFVTRWGIAPLNDLSTANGTWTKAPLARWVAVTVIGGGAGGGSGRRGAAASARAGGQGGQSGVLNRWTFNAASLGATETVTVGNSITSAAGGNAQTVDSTDGNAGTVGGSSSFGTHLVALGGNVGAGGSSAATAANTAIQAIGGAAALASVTTSITATSVPPGSVPGAGTGGNGGSISTGNVGFAGAAGAGGSAASNTQTNGGTSGAAGNNAGGNGDSISDTVNQFGGAGGGGGGGNSAGVGGAGGNGGTPGGGGGGGGASLNANNSGAGGTGARGEVRITTYF